MALLLQLIDRVVSNQLALNKDEFTVGREKDNDLIIEDMSVSSYHAKIIREEDPYYDGHFRYFLEDAGSTNGTFVNNQKVVRQELTNNDAIKFGWNDFKFLSDDYQKYEATAHILDGL